MSENKKIIQSIVGECLKEYSPKIKNNYWYFDFPECIIGLMLSKSRWGGEKYYFDIGINIKQLNMTPFPKDKEFGCRQSPKFISSDTEDLDEYLNFDNQAMSLSERENKITTIVNSIIIPFINEASTIAGIKTLGKNGKLKGAAIYKEFREILDV